MPKVTGKIEALSQKDTKFGIKVGEDWYNKFGQCEYKKGDTVEIDFETTDSGFKNIKTITGGMIDRDEQATVNVGTASTTGEVFKTADKYKPINDNQMQMLRMNALKSVCNFASGMAQGNQAITFDEVLRLTKQAITLLETGEIID